MNIQKVDISQIYNKNSNTNRADKRDVNFTGVLDVASNIVTQGFRFLDTNQAVGANLVDLGFMVIPRTWIDFSNRGTSAGFETARREATGTTNHSLVGVYGTLGGLALATASGLNSKYNIRAHKIFADNNTMNIIAKSWHDAIHSGDNDVLKRHINNLVDNIRVFNTDANNIDGFVKIAKEDAPLVKNALYEALSNAKPKDIIPDKVVDYVYNLITASTGGEKNVILLGENGANASNTLKTLIKNIFNVTNAFNTENSIQAFKNAVNVADNSLLKSLRGMNSNRSKIGLGIATAVGMATQPINMYLTKKKTGSDGFVGVEGREKDNSVGFKIKKTIAALAFGLGAFATITTNPKKFASKLQFQGALPTINQLKFVYGLTIVSRFLSARDSDELRESAVKDTLGFLNLLVLGTLVAKYSARIFNSNLVNKLDDTGKSFWFKVKNELNSSLKTRDEILLSALKKDGISVVKDGKALPIKELLKLVDEIKDPASKYALKEQLRALNFSQLIGYLYSGLVLGVGIPKLNIYMTKKSEEKRQARLTAQNNISGKPFDNMVKNENQQFLKEYSFKGSTFKKLS